MASFSMGNKLYLAVARSFKNFCPVNDFGSLLFDYERGSFKLVQRMALEQANHVHHFESTGHHFLAFGSDDAIHVFRNEQKSGCQFSSFQQIQMNHLKDFKLTSFGPRGQEHVMITTAGKSEVSVHLYNGYSGFDKSWVMPVTEGRAILPYAIDNRFYLIVTQNPSCSGATVFEAIIKGSSLLPLTTSSQSSSSYTNVQR